nr:hypothetical protein BgiMline_030450 [Biomphalaria glabrata]
MCQGPATPVSGSSNTCVRIQQHMCQGPATPVSGSSNTCVRVQQFVQQHMCHGPATRTRTRSRLNASVPFRRVAATSADVCPSSLMPSLLLYT